MKKRYFIPTLMLLSCTALTSCGGGGGLIVNGQPYMEGQARAINQEVQDKVENSFKKVTMSMKTSISIKQKYQGRSYSASATVSGSAVVDIENRTIEYTYSGGSSLGGSGKIKIKAQEVDGQWVITNSSNIDVDLSGSDFELMFDQTSYQVYSWNYTLDEERLNNLIGNAEGADIDTQEILSMYNDLQSSLVFTGDFASGTFDIGLSKAVKFSFSGVDVSYNKMKYSFKEGLLRSLVTGLSVSYVEDDIQLVIGATVSESFSYSKTSSSSKPSNPFGF